MRRGACHAGGRRVRAADTGRLADAGAGSAAVGGTRSTTTPRLAHARAAVRLASRQVRGGRPYDVEDEHVRGRLVWDVEVAVRSHRPHAFLVSANGKRLVRRGRARRDDDAARMKRARIPLDRALWIAGRRATGRFSEAEIDSDRRGARSFGKRPSIAHGTSRQRSRSTLAPARCSPSRQTTDRPAESQTACMRVLERLPGAQRAGYAAGLSGGSGSLAARLPNMPASLRAAVFACVLTDPCSPCQWAHFELWTDGRVVPASPGKPVRCIAQAGLLAQRSRLLSGGSLTFGLAFSAAVR
jgi:hypothetical protein